jgi:hypothetical protein
MGGTAATLREHDVLSLNVTGDTREKTLAKLAEEANRYFGEAGWEVVDEIAVVAFQTTDGRILHYDAGASFRQA